MEVTRLDIYDFKVFLSPIDFKHLCVVVDKTQFSIEAALACVIGNGLIDFCMDFQEKE